MAELFLFVFLLLLLVIIFAMMNSNSGASSVGKIPSLSETESKINQSYAEAELLHLASEGELLTTAQIKSERYFESSSDYTEVAPISQPNYFGNFQVKQIPLLAPSSPLNFPKLPQQPSYVKMFQDRLRKQEQELLELTAKIKAEQEKERALESQLENLLNQQQQAEITQQKLTDRIDNLEQEKTNLQKSIQKTKFLMKIGGIGLGIIIIGLILFWIDANYRNQAMQQQLSQLERVENSPPDPIITQLKKERENLTQQQNVFQFLLQLSGWQNQQIINLQASQRREQIFKANQKYQELVNQLQKTPKRATILYYPKSIEPQDIIKNSCQNLGFSVAILKPKVKEIPTNYLLYSADVTLTEVKLVAYSLIRAGVELKYIGNLRLNAHQSSLIEIGAEPKFESNQTLTLEQIDSLTGAN